LHCLFCKEISSTSKSVEHIIPESLGNKDIFLPKGIVCDSCNQYFAIKVEKPVLEMKYFRNLRFRNNIKSKKGKNTPYKTLFPNQEGGWFDMYMGDDGCIGFNNDESKIINLIKNQKVNSMMFEVVDSPKENDFHISRFLAKAALESLAFKLVDNFEWIDELINKKELDPLREYARYGKGAQWIYNQRRIYSEESRFKDIVHHPEPYEVLHEMDFLIVEPGIYYYVLVIMGVEYVINCGASELELYNNWLNNNNNRSPVRRWTERMIVDQNK
jgi:hypothetical protein|tara:strand:+ start:3153 stop:3968 length:816 start_codon:yes stop_codon:yes gene_type:complete